MIRRLSIVILLTLFLFGFSFVTHKGITEKAFEYLPEMMDGFQNKFQANLVSPISAYYMLPDLEEPGHSMERIAELTEQYFNALVENLKNENIEEVEKNIGRVAHMIGDAVSPTQNDSQTWGDIDDYYDDQITDPFFYQMTFTRLDQNGLTQIEDIYTFTLGLCQASTAYVDDLINAYNQYNDSPQTVFEQTKAIFEEQISIGIKALEDVLYTAWIQAGRPDYGDEPDDGGCSIL